MKILTFKRHHRMYTPGDVAGFDDEPAQRLIDAGVATEGESESPASSEAGKPEQSKADSSKSADAKK